jgi:hypothetical protein
MVQYFVAKYFAANSKHMIFLSICSHCYTAAAAAMLVLWITFIKSMSWKLGGCNRDIKLLAVSAESSQYSLPTALFSKHYSYRFMRSTIVHKYFNHNASHLTFLILALQNGKNVILT